MTYLFITIEAVVVLHLEPVLDVLAERLNDLP